MNINKALLAMAYANAILEHQAREAAKEQEPLGEEFQQIIADRLEDMLD